MDEFQDAADDSALLGGDSDELGGSDDGDDSGGDGNGNVMSNYDATDAADDDGSLQKTSNLKVDFDRSDVEFWFQQLEMHLTTAGIKAQWTKRLLLHKQLPNDVIAELKDLLRKDKAAAGATPYKDLKDMILETFGIKKEDAYEEAEGYLLTGKPSQLAKKLINKLCPNHPHLNNCCAAGIIAGMWQKKLPFEVRQAVAGMSLEGEATLKDTLRKADAAYATLQSRGTSAAPAHAPLAAVDFDTSADAPALQQVAAVRGRYPPKRGGGQRKGQAQAGARDRGEPHPDNPPSTACNTHWKYGLKAFTCRKEETCPWASKVPPKNKK